MEMLHTPWGENLSTNYLVYKIATMKMQNQLYKVDISVCWCKMCKTEIIWRGECFRGSFFLATIPSCNYCVRIHIFFNISSMKLTWHGEAAINPKRLQEERQQNELFGETLLNNRIFFMSFPRAWFKVEEQPHYLPCLFLNCLFWIGIWILYL